MGIALRASHTKFLTIAIAAATSMTHCAYAEKVAQCSAHSIEEWNKHNPFGDTSMRASLKALPSTPCWINNGNGAYLCKRDVGCSRYNPDTQ